MQNKNWVYIYKGVATTARGFAIDFQLAYVAAGKPSSIYYSKIRPCSVGVKGKQTEQSKFARDVAIAARVEFQVVITGGRK